MHIHSGSLHLHHTLANFGIKTFGFFDFEPYLQSLFIFLLFWTFNIVVTYVQFDSNIHVLYVFLGFFKNTAQNMQSGKGYAKNHYRAAKIAVC